MNKSSPNRRLSAHFFGRGQGVGFRFTVCALAEPLRITGYVRNQPSGNVELVAEGSEDMLNNLLHRIKESRVGRYIIRTDVSWSPATDEFEGFRISF